jgi:hypothetical protein
MSIDLKVSYHHALHPRRLLMPCSACNSYPDIRRWVHMLDLYPLHALDPDIQEPCPLQGKRSRLRLVLRLEAG